MTSTEHAPESANDRTSEQPSRSGLLGLTGPLLAWIRKKAGWTREAFCRKIRWTKVDEKEAGSSRQYQTYEGSMEATPIVVQRYRRVIGDTLFDELWEKGRTLFDKQPLIPHKERKLHGNHPPIPQRRASRRKRGETEGRAPQ